MSEDTRGNLTFILWFFSALVLGALFISSAAQGELTLGHILLAFVILALAAAGTLYLLHWTDSEAQQTKAKRQRIDSLLSNMSDEELLELKQRLSEGEFGEEARILTVGDDGELVRRS